MITLTKELKVKMPNSLCQTNHISEPNDNTITVITISGFYCNFGDYWLILLMKADQAILDHKVKQKNHQNSTKNKTAIQSKNQLANHTEK